MAETRRQVSSGGVIFRRSQGAIEVALIAVKEGSIWGLPKGLVEKNEALEAAAVREVKEETGLEGTLLGKIGDLKYVYTVKEKAKLIRFFKTVHFYLIEYTKGRLEDHDWEVFDARWFPIDEAIEKASYKSEKEILQKAKLMLEQDVQRSK